MKIEETERLLKKQLLNSSIDSSFLLSLVTPLDPQTKLLNLVSKLSKTVSFLVDVQTHFSTLGRLILVLQVFIVKFGNSKSIQTKSQNKQPKDPRVRWF